jgi:endonuclease YncB( thermonuclease family)
LRLGFIVSLVLGTLITLTTIISAYAHPGGLDRQGCHNDRKRGGYHCHQRRVDIPLYEPKTVKPRKAARLKGTVKPVPLISTDPAFDTVNLPKSAKAIDGDTIRANRSKPDIRLVGCDTPETTRAKCTAESKLGTQAKTYLQKLIATGQLTVEIVRCACPSGTEGTDKCNKRRRCGVVRLGSKNVCETMISEGLAQPFFCGPTSCPPQPKWCVGDDNLY